jgi:hypothetical protein
MQIAVPGMPVMSLSHLRSTCDELATPSCTTLA